MYAYMMMYTCTHATYMHEIIYNIISVENTAYYVVGCSADQYRPYPPFSPLAWLGKMEELMGLAQIYLID